MRSAVSLPAAVLIVLLVAGFAAGEEQRPYKHPEVDMQFTVGPGWEHLPRPGDEGTHERVDPGTGIHVLMWFTTTEMSAERYLGKMAHMMDVVVDSKMQARTIAGREAWVHDLPGTIRGMKVRTLLAVIASGKSRVHPRENNLYIVQIWCPAEDHLRLAQRMDELLDSVRITDRLILEGRHGRLHPETTDSPPDLPSPFVAPSGEEFVTVRTQEGRYGVVPVKPWRTARPKTTTMASGTRTDSWRWTRTISLR